MSQLLAYINNEAAGDEAILASSGVEIKKQRTPATQLPAPKNVAAKPGTTGTAKISTGGVKGASAYKVEKSTNSSPFAWEAAGMFTGKSIKITGLTPGTLVWFRVTGLNKAGDGIPSDPASVTAAISH